MKLSKADIERLQQEPSPAVRAGLAEKIAQGFNAGMFSAAETALAVEIFRLLLRDVEVRVRKALSENLKHNMRLPHDVALKLARDVADVSAPMLEYSYVLTEDDLMEIVRSTKVAAKLLAVSRRGSISRGLSHELLKTRNDAVMHVLFANGGASFAEADIVELLPELMQKEQLLEALIHRGELSMPLVDRLFDTVSDHLKKMLATKYRLSRHLAEDAVQQAVRWSKKGTYLRSTKDENAEQLVDKLYHRKQLTYGVLLRALCSGDLCFFEAAMARLAGIPLINARLLMLDPGPLGFKALYNISPLPPTLYEAIKALFDVALEVTAYGKFHREDFRDRMIERIMAHRYDIQVEHMPYLMSIIGKETLHAQAIH